MRRTSGEPLASLRGKGKHTLALLEAMDDRKVTRRSGDERTLLGG